MSKLMDELAADLRARLIELDGLGDFGTARAEGLRLLVHDVYEMAEMMRHLVAGYAEMVVHQQDILKRLERLERMYLPHTGPQ